VLHSYEVGTVLTVASIQGTGRGNRSLQKIWSGGDKNIDVLPKVSVRYVHHGRNYSPCRPSDGGEGSKDHHQHHHHHRRRHWFTYFSVICAFVLYWFVSSPLGKRNRIALNPISADHFNPYPNAHVHNFTNDVAGGWGILYFLQRGEGIWSYVTDLLFVYVAI